MNDTEKLALCKAIINNTFEYGIESSESCMAVMNDLLVVIEFNGGTENVED